MIVFANMIYEMHALAHGVSARNDCEFRLDGFGADVLAVLAGQTRKKNLRSSLLMDSS